MQIVDFTVLYDKVAFISAESTSSLSDNTASEQVQCLRFPR